LRFTQDCVCDRLALVGASNALDLRCNGFINARENGGAEAEGRPADWQVVPAEPV
jgi:hypothetical protein